MKTFIPSTILENEIVILRPLRDDDFEALYSVAADPLIWEQHPNKTRYQRPVFETYFKGAMESNSAYLVSDKVTGDVIGCSRFYDYDPIQNTICIGYTFLSRICWGKSYNRALKSIMLDYAFKLVDTVIFHVGKNNMRSQKAMEKLGAEKTGEQEMSYYGEDPHINFVYCVYKHSGIN